ncbi:MAG: urea ABC transporter permease subunit UrtB, partial [Pseudomonadota bacterium]|nr:urea ABC transporter permease subunit UrtB [Pseudomonadota bacterium]
MLRATLLVIAFCLALPAQMATAQDSPLQTLLQSQAGEVAKPGRKSVGVVIDALVAETPEGTALFLERWQNKGVFLNETDGLFYYAQKSGDGYELFDIATDTPVGTATKDELTEIRPNGGVRRVIGGALVQFQLSDPDKERRTAALDAILRSPDASQIEPLRASIEGEPDNALRARKERLANLLTARFGASTDDRITAINALSGTMDVDSRAALNQILTKSASVAPKLPQDANIARVLTVGEDISQQDAYAQLVDAGLAPERQTADTIKARLSDNIVDGRVGGMPVGQLSSEANRERAYAALAQAGTVPPLVTDETVQAAIATHAFFETYAESDAAITTAAETALSEVEARVARNQIFDVSLDAISLASIYFLAAIGLAITFGVMGVINMAHGEFIMMGAYTGYVVQQIIPDYTLSLVVALPLAFAVTFAAGVAMERLVIRWLYHRPLETLLATFGISIALQQLAKNIFGTQARPLTSPGWLDGAWVINDVVQIANIRIAIFVLALIFLGLILFVLNKTRLGLEVRAVTQNPGMAASMGINPDRINMLTFGLGSGIAGI